jgi:molecular chaperone HscB
MTTHFERLGLPGRFSVDTAEVERAYLTRTRQAHPDFHGLADADRQRASLDETAALNEAYLTLNDPFRRAEYLLTMLGGPTAAQEKNLDQQFLMEMMDLRERIEQARTGGGLDEIEKELTARLAGIVNQLGDQFLAIEQLPADDPARQPRLLVVRQLLNAAKTVRSLLRDLGEV